MAAKFAIVSMKAVVEAKRLDPHFFIEDDGPEVLKARQIVDNHKQRLAKAKAKLRTAEKAAAPHKAWRKKMVKAGKIKITS